MKKHTLLAAACFSLLTTVTSFASLAPQCKDTWNNSSAAQTCGVVCTGEGDQAGHAFNSTYNKTNDTCTYDAGCCEGMPYQKCVIPYAVCDGVLLTVKRGDSKFHNDHGHIVHD
jgi:hypothetical protein